LQGDIDPRSRLGDSANTLRTYREWEGRLDAVDAADGSFLLLPCSNGTMREFPYFFSSAFGQSYMRAVAVAVAINLFSLSFIVPSRNTMSRPR